MARQYYREHQQFNPVALQNLNVGEAYFHGGRLHVDPDAHTFPTRKKSRAQSRRHYGRRREIVEPIITGALLSLVDRPNAHGTYSRKRRRLDV
jgi:hypothetical protein